MKRKTGKRASLLLFLAFCLAPYVVAAAVTKVRLSKLSDMDLGFWNFTSMSGNDPVCAFRNDGIGAYQIRATDNSTMTPGGFYLQNGASTEQIAYSLFWGNTPSPGAVALPDGVTVAASGANVADRGCNGGDSANISVSVNNSALAAVPYGTYTATVTLVMQP